MDDAYGSLIREIEKFLAETGMPPSRFGRLVANDSTLLPRIRRQGQCLTATIVKIRQFITEQRAARQEVAQ